MTTQELIDSLKWFDPEAEIDIVIWGSKVMYDVVDVVESVYGTVTLKAEEPGYK